MKKIIALFLSISMLAAIAIPCMALSLNDSGDQTDLIYYDDFSNPGAHTYSGQNLYTASVTNGKLDLQYTGESSSCYAYLFPDAPALTTETKLTIALSFTMINKANGQGIFPVFGADNNENFFLAGSNTGYGDNAQIFYSEIENHALKAGGYSFAYLMRDEEKSVKFNYDAAKQYEIIVEIEEGQHPVISIFEDGEQVMYYPKDTNAINDVFKNTVDLEGQIGICLRNGTHLSVDSLAVYRTTGLTYGSIFKTYGKLIWADDFSNPAAHDYTQDSFTATVSDGKLNLQVNTATDNANDYFAYLLPGVSALKTEKSMAIALSFSVSGKSNGQGFLPAFGASDADNFFAAGITTGFSDKAQIWFGKITDHTVNGAKRNYAYLMRNEAKTEKLTIDTTTQYELIVELNEGQNPIITLFENGVKATYHYESESNLSLYDFSGNLDLEGKFGICLTRGATISIDWIKVYSEPTVGIVSGDLEFLLSNGNLTLVRYRGDDETLILQKTYTIDDVAYPLVAIGGYTDSATGTDYGAFDGIPSLKDVTIPESVVSIGDETYLPFAGCSNLETVTIYGNPTVADGAFGNTQKTIRGYSKAPINNGTTVDTHVRVCANKNSNLTFEALDAVEYKGYQTTDMSGSNFSIRFVSGIMDLRNQSAGFDITEYNNSKTWGKTCQSVYESISATINGEAATAVTANDLGVNYLVALAVRNVPTGEALSFTVKPYLVNPLGAKVYGVGYLVDVATDKTITVRKALRVATYNLASAKYMNGDLESLAQDILDQQIDVIGLQEVSEYSAFTGGESLLEKLKEYTGYGYSYFTNLENPNNSAETQAQWYGNSLYYGIGFLSKYPITASSSTYLYGGFDQHPGDAEVRGLQQLTLNVNGQTLHFYNTHFTSDSRVLDREFSVTAAALSQYDDYILSGDFNIDDLSEFDALPSGKTLLNRRQYATAPKITRYFDNLIVSPNYQVLDVGMVSTVEMGHSDHNMLWAEVVYRG